MTKREPKPKIEVPTRQVRAKGGMFDNLRKQGEVESLTIEELVATPETALDHPEPPKTALRPPEAGPVAPVRDFNKRANVLDRDALPRGLFPGSSKKLYDALYIRTLGAVVPTKTIQATRRELREWSGIKNVKTVASHLRHLETVGLVLRAWDRGDNEGSVYEVRLPAGLRPPKTTLRDPDPPEGALGRKMVLPSGPISASGGLSQTVDSQRASETPNTSLKTNTKDDDELMPLLRVRVEKPMPKTEVVLLSLLDTLEARTDVSSPDSLLAHVLTQKLSPRGKSAQRRPSEGQFRDRPVQIEVTDEDLAEYERNRNALRDS